MSNEITNPKEVVKALDEKIDALMTKVNDQKADKADFAELKKSFDNLKASFAAAGEDSDREMKKYANGKIQWTKQMRQQAVSMVTKSLDQAGFFTKAEVSNPEELRKAYLQKATNVNEIDSTSGSAMLQTAVDSVINKIIPLYGVARKNVRVITGVRGSLNLNSRNALPTFARTVNTVVRDDATVTPNSPTFTHVTIQPAQSSGIAKITNKLIYDSIPGVLEDVVEQLAIQAGLAEDTELFLGDGTATYNSFTGLKTATIGQNNTFVGARTGSFSNFDTLLQCRQQVAPAIARSEGTKFHMHPFTFAVLQQFKASTSGLYFYDLTSNEWKVSGTPIEFNQVMDGPDTGGASFAIGKVPVIFGDLSKAVVLAIGRDYILKTLLELYAATNETGIQLSYDFAFGIVKSDACCKIQIVS